MHDVSESYAQNERAMHYVTESYAMHQTVENYIMNIVFQLAVGPCGALYKEKVKSQLL
jgi:hypothetical protein